MPIRAQRVARSVIRRPRSISSTTLLGQARLVPGGDQALEQRSTVTSTQSGSSGAVADGADDPLGARRLRALVGVEELLVQLLAGADAR